MSCHNIDKIGIDSESPSILLLQNNFQGVAKERKTAEFTRIYDTTKHFLHLS